MRAGWAAIELESLFPKDPATVPRVADGTGDEFQRVDAKALNKLFQI
jgi:hypothetical protein